MGASQKRGHADSVPKVQESLLESASEKEGPPAATPRERFRMNFKALESKTKLRGGYYTHPDLAAFLLRWVQQAKPRHLVEPSCGDGVFFSVLTEVGNGSVEKFTGFEIEPAEASKAVAAAGGAPWAEVHVRDFLHWSLLHLNQPLFDAAVGNPPFIRYQYLAPELQALSEQIFRHLRLRVSLRRYSRRSCGPRWQQARQRTGIPL